MTRLPSDARLKFGTGEYVTALEQLVVPLRIGSGRYRVRVHVLPGSLPILVVSRPTLTSMGAVRYFKRHVLRIDEQELRLDISPLGHYTLNGLGVAGEHQLAGVAAVAADTAPASPAALLAAAVTSASAARADQDAPTFENTPVPDAPSSRPVQSVPAPILTKETANLDQA